MLLRVASRRLLPRASAGKLRRPFATTKNEHTGDDAGKSDALASPWTRVYDESSRGYYWWNKSSDETTAVGDPRPTSYHLEDVREEYHEERRVGVGAQMGQAFVMGAGVSVGFAAVGVAARAIFGG